MTLNTFVDIVEGLLDGLFVGEQFMRVTGFEDQDLTDYNMPGTQYVPVISDDVAHGGTYSVKLPKAGQSYFYMPEVIDTDVNIFKEFSAWCYPMGTNCSFNIFLLTEATPAHQMDAGIWFYTDGYMYCGSLSGAQSHKLDAYSAESWYQFKIINNTDLTVDYYINDVLQAAGVEHTFGADTYQSDSWSCENWSNSGSDVYVDDLRVSVRGAISKYLIKDSEDSTRGKKDTYIRLKPSAAPPSLAFDGSVIADTLAGSIEVFAPSADERDAILDEIRDALKDGSYPFTITSGLPTDARNYHMYKMNLNLLV